MKYFFGVLIGAIIGYITNWVAIKMLFRPHYEKRILGFKVPFTPGLIPKEKSRISKSIGETVGNHLLTNEVIINALNNDNIKIHLKNIIKEQVNEFSNSNQSINEVLQLKLGKYYTKLRIKAEYKISDYILNRFNDEGLIDTVSKFVTDKIIIGLSEKPDKLKAVLENDKFYALFLNKFANEEDKEKLSSFICRNLDEDLNKFINEDKCIEELIPSEIFAALNVYMFNERHSIVNKLLSMLREEEVEIKIKEAIKNNVLSGMNSLASMFINVDSLYDKFLVAIDGYLGEEDNIVYIVSYLGEAASNFGKKTVGEVLSAVPENSKQSIMNTISKSIVEKALSKEIIDEGLKFITDKVDNFHSYHQILIRISENYQDKITDYIRRVLRNTFKSSDISVKINNVIRVTLDDILDNSMSIAMPYDNKVADEIYSIAERIYDKFINNEASSIINLINIPQVVEKQINSFDVDYAEKIILEIANKELAAITWLGALLGGILGILSPLLATIGA
ncbi:DUF445 family protein [Clostridium manihotivorum]|uniref:DUF445 family protein n=1 Tax=Clostridium manihotivorum TaxID=2320868 RepID=A0A3R5U3I9_9CLOT|nr:DUF445 family protein [Clostridium manihotivorum]QAA30683.1 hypothetical protein C1I91_02810 [Clostridium manihotivorum]